MKHQILSTYHAVVDFLFYEKQTAFTSQEETNK